MRILIPLLILIGNFNCSTANSITPIFVDSLNDLSFDLGSSYPDSAFSIAKKSLHYAKKINYVNGQMTAYCRLGRSIYKKGNLDSSLFYFNKSENLFHSKGKDSIFLSKTYIYQGLVNYKLGRLNLALEKYNKAYSIAKSKQDEKIMGSCLVNISTILIAQNEYDHALGFLNDAISRFSNTNYIKIGGIYLNIGNIYEIENRNDDALKSYKLAYKNFALIDDALNKAKSLMNIGNVLLNLHRPKTALSYYDRSFSIAKKKGFGLILSKISQNKGEYYYTINEMDSAFFYFLESLKRKTSNGSTTGLSLSYERLGDIYLSQKQFSKSLNHYLTGYESAIGLIDHIQLKDLTLKISNVYSILGKADSAFIYLDYSRNYQDTISKQLNQALIYEINFNKEKHKVDQLQLKLDQQASVLKKQTTISWLSMTIGVIAILLLLGMINFYRQRRNNIRKQQKIDQLLNKQGEETMNAMLTGQETEKTRIAGELHDRLGSMLSTVKLYFKSMDKEIDQLKKENVEQFEKANNLLDEACDEVRKIAHDLSTGVLTDQGLFRAVKNLIEKIEGSGELKIELTTHGTDDDLLIVNQSAVYRIIQESLSNILKHANAKKVSIQLNVFDDLFNLIIEDDGVGFDANQLVSNSGMGLRSNKVRVSKMEGTFNIDSGKGIGTTINIDIPLKFEK